MKIELNRHANVPLAQQIYRAFADRILSGQFEKGNRLPSVRQLTRTLRVSPVTVSRAFKLLEDQKLVTRIQGKGTFVYEDTPPKDNKTPDNIQLHMPDYLHRSQSVYYHQKPAAINFSSSAVHTALLPTAELAQSLKQLAREQPDTLGQYGEIQGDLELRQAMAKYLSQEDIAVSPQEILVTNGSQQGIDLVARSFLGPGDVVFTEEPTYAAAIDVFRSRGATVIPVPMDEEGMRLDALTKLLDTYTPTLIYTIPTYHNPTGRVMSARRRKALLQLTQDIRCLILEDDPWSEIYFDEPPPPHIKSMDREGNVIYLKGLSKVLSPGCRVGFLIAPVPLLKPLITAKTYADLGNPLLNQKVVLPIIRSGKLSDLFTDLRTALKQRRDRTIRLLRPLADAHVSWAHPRGGFNLWLTLPEYANANDLLVEVAKRKISFLPGSSCYPNDIEWHHLRLSFSSVTEEKLDAGVRELCAVTTSYLSRLSKRKGATPLF